MKTYSATLLVLAFGLAGAGAARAANGDLDTTFGDNGIALTGLTDAAGNGAYGPVIQPDGRILVCDSRRLNGSSGSDFFVARFDADGTLDSSFSFDGKVTIDFDAGTGSDTCLSIALQSDGKIVVAGSTRSPSTQGDDFAIARLNADGTLDTTFGAGTGKTTVAFDLGDSNTDSASAVVIQADGRIVVAGSAQTASNGSDFAVVRLLADGTPDAAFNLTGKITLGFDLAASVNKNDSASAVAIDTQQRIVLGGGADAGASTSSNDFAIARLLPNGQPDANFDADGRVTIAFDVGDSANDVALAMVIQEGGDIVLAGAADTSPVNGTPNYSMAVARVLPDGTPDAGFGIGGKTLIPFDLTPNGVDAAFGIAAQANGKLIVVGYSQQLPTGQIAGAAARLNPNASLDNGFGTLGKKTYDFGLTTPSSQVLHGVAIAGTRIIASGGALVPGTDAIDDFVVRLQDDLIFADGFD